MMYLLSIYIHKTPPYYFPLTISPSAGQPKKGTKKEAARKKKKQKKPRKMILFVKDRPLIAP